jgi:calcium/calmodulin-dependent protein kinase I
VQQVLSATLHLHEKDIVHRDLKPENLLLESDEDDSPVKLADFGLSAFCKKGDKLTKAVGTPGYIAPEILMTLDEDLDGYNVEVDNWSIGIIMYILLCGFPPFYAEDDDECFDMIIAGEFDFPSPYWDNISDDAKDLLRKLLVVDPAKRLTAAEALQHPWVAGSAAPDAQLSENQASLKKFVARQRWKKAINTTIALQKFSAWGKRRAAEKK